MAFGRRPLKELVTGMETGERGLINLSDPARPPIDEYPGSDVFIFVDTATICGEALSNLSEYDVIGKSITIISPDDESDGVVFHHRKDERIV